MAEDLFALGGPHDGHFTVAIFGSARIKEQDPLYNEVYELSKMISREGIDIVTGGGPGLMKAANQGHKDGRKALATHSIGFTVKLPFGEQANAHLDVKKDFARFSQRLDQFMLLSNAVVVTPGGVGTLLELLYTWQLVQVKHVCGIPIILFGEMWPDLIKWVEAWPLQKNYLGKQDIELLYYAKDRESAMEIIRSAHEAFKKGGKDFCLNYEKYKIG